MSTKTKGRQLRGEDDALGAKRERYAMSAESDWLQKLQALAIRYSHFGVNHDLASLSLAELYGVYLWLRGLGDGA